MHLKKIELFNFKNYDYSEIELHHGVNIFTGNNGAGKSNVLDAVYYLSFCKSFLNHVDSQNIKHNQEMMAINGWLAEEPKSIELKLALKKGEKKQFKKNKKNYESLADHIGLVPAVIIAPNDTNLIDGGSELRRKFIDGVISQYHKDYLTNLISLQKVLKQRNALLKKMKEQRRLEKDHLVAWDAQLLHFTEPIHKMRREFLEEFSPMFQTAYNTIAQADEEVSLKYESAILEHDYEFLLKSSIEKDFRMGYTTEGVHKEDLSFLLNGYKLKKYGSQGQQKSFVLALKLAQFELLKKKLSKVPLLLLDDIFDKLDHKRVKSLIEMVVSSCL